MERKFPKVSAEFYWRSTILKYCIYFPITLLLSVSTVADVQERITRVRSDVKGTDWARAPLACYIVPAMSAIKRLPDVIPSDGKLGSTLNLIAAQGEFEPVSFVAFPFVDIARLEVKATDLAGGGATIPASTVDVKTVKCWYQAGTAWHSYFADPTRRELTPELLLNDDSLIKVDRKTKDNYLRVDYPAGSEYVWVSYPKRADPGLFNHATEPVADSRKLLPVRLTAGEAKQFWITVRPPSDAAAGQYSGKIGLTADGISVGELTLNLRVLPFQLPLPRTYYDLEREFYTGIYNHCSIAGHLVLNGDDFEQAGRKLKAELENMRDHNLMHPLVRGHRGKRLDALKRQLELMKEVGLSTRPLFGGVHAFTDYGWMRAPKDKRGSEVFETFKKHVDQGLAVIEEVLGHHDVYCDGWDEPGQSTLVSQRECWDYVHSKGARIYSTGRDMHLEYAGFNEDFINYPGWPNSESARKWHALGGRITSYAGPHTGPENPDYIRRTHGMQLYKADYDGTFNYQYYEGNPNIWNDFEKTIYRSFCMVYPTKEGVIDTIAWEGFREAVDDVRYATKMRQLANAAIATGKVGPRYAGKKAIQWLANFDEKSGDLNTMRMEMINTILALHAIIAGNQP